MVAGSFGWTEKMTLRAWLDREHPADRALTPENLHTWVSAYVEKHGAYPTRTSLGPASPRGYWDWCEIDNALVRQSAGWEGRTSLNAWIQNRIALAKEAEAAPADLSQIVAERAPTAVAGVGPKVDATLQDDELSDNQGPQLQVAL